MTRINCVPVEELTNKHLVAEYREMLRLRHATMKPTDIIPDTYRLGKGHVRFFYDKGAYLVRRHAELCDEMLRRGFTVNYALDLSAWHPDRFNEWTPDTTAMELNRARIRERLES